MEMWKSTQKIKYPRSNAQASVGCRSEASYTFVFQIILGHDTAFMHPTQMNRNLRICRITVQTITFPSESEKISTQLKTGRLQELDIEHLIEALENMARRDKHQLINHLIILLAYLLKWEFQLQQLSEMWGTYEGKSWRNTILEQRAHKPVRFAEI